MRHSPLGMTRTVLGSHRGFLLGALFASASRRGVTSFSRSHSRPQSSLKPRMSAGSNAGDRLQWEDLRVAPAELRPDSTLTMGQCFNWKKIDCGGVEDKYWIGMLGPHALIIRQQLHTTEYLSLGGEALQPLLWDYFQLDFQLAHLYEQWGAGCERMQIVTERIRGVRVVRQDPWECLISFICSSNNNIARIGQMLDKLRLTYGTYRCSLVCAYDVGGGGDVGSVGDVGDGGAESVVGGDAGLGHSLSIDLPGDGRWQVVYGSPPEGGYLHRHDLYDFPTAESLAAASEADLRALGMGYRAKFIKGSAQLVVDKTRAGEAGWFEQMRGIAQAAQAVTEGQPLRRAGVSAGAGASSASPSRGARVKQEVSEWGAPATATANEARLQVQQLLLELPGVGRKVADCVALFSLDQTAAIPVDTHVWNIAIRDYAPELRRSAVITSPTPGGTGEKEKSFVKSEGSEGSIKVEVKGESTHSSHPSHSHSHSQAPPTPTPSTPLAPTPSTPASIETKSLTPSVYEAVGDVFRDRFGVHAGWAHSVLFAAELGSFREKLPPYLQEEMRLFADQQRSAKKVKREEKLEQKEQKEQKGGKGSKLEMLKEEEEEEGEGEGGDGVKHERSPGKRSVSVRSGGTPTDSKRQRAEQCAQPSVAIKKEKKVGKMEVGQVGKVGTEKEPGLVKRPGGVRTLVAEDAPSAKAAPKGRKK